MDLPALSRDGDVQRRIELAREERLRLARETRMLELALEELCEEAGQADSEEAAARGVTNEAERELLRCLLQYAVHTTLAEPVDDSVASDSAIGCSDDASSAELCAVLEQYKAAQDRFTVEARQRLARLQAAVQTEVADPTDTEPGFELHGRNMQADAAHRESAYVAPETHELQALRCELELLREMRSEVDGETDKTLQTVGRTLFA